MVGDVNMFLSTEASESDHQEEPLVGEKSSGLDGGDSPHLRCRGGLVAEIDIMIAGENAVGR
jgi:hypothetical protein